MKTKSIPLKTAQAARDELVARGISVTHWAISHGVSPHVAQQVLRGLNAGSRGQGHRVAVLLGLKASPAPTEAAP